MDTTIKKQWVNALRSGEFKQGTGALRWSNPIPMIGSGDRYTSEFCCLGVLCSTQGKQYDYATVRSTGLDGAEVSLLIAMNDKEKKTFNQIADYIEREL